LSRKKDALERRRLNSRADIKGIKNDKVSFLLYFLPPLLSILFFNTEYLNDSFRRRPHQERPGMLEQILGVFSDIRRQNPLKSLKIK
jgi:hypothetical protein